MVEEVVEEVDVVIQEEEGKKGRLVSTCFI